jgi:hypothetical protein
MVFHEFEEQILIDQWNHEHIMDLNQMGNAILSISTAIWKYIFILNISEWTQKKHPYVFTTTYGL